MRVREQANGIAYTEQTTTVVFPFGDVGPYLVWHQQVITIEQPERFGPYGTPKERRAFMRKFTREFVGEFGNG